MLNYTVEKRIDIESTADHVIEFLADYRNWPEWSPWLIMERECKLDYRGEQGNIGDGYSWKGDLVGSGEMTLMKRTSHQLEMHLRFFKPFKSEAHVSFQAVQMGVRSEVRWTMSSQVPWYLFFLKGLFKTMIGMDYDRGLKMLKAKLEVGQVNSELLLIGERQQDNVDYIGLRGSGAINEIGPIMREHIEKLLVLIEEKHIPATGALFSYYQSMKMETQFFEFITCVPIERQLSVPEPFVSGQIKACDTYVVKHTGEYQFLGNAWSMAMNASRHQKVKVKRKPLGIERYINNPEQVAAHELVTEVILFKR
ncbi:SRPBCC family protein [Vibrio barjaei]|jgi:predicted transcriptional regulator YdeE|uniref:SRPBCC family protein n=1 Tax=Vibrio barjaei TaxID=1676683 RepID=UPI0022837F6C|nr:SRPBCC family protein [Vibrio barjaei]MCY9871017.1 SRPBCC family protein [Vibrio barjaei]